MYKSEFDRLLATDLETKSFLLWGEEPYYIKKYSNLIKERIGDGENALTLYYDEYDFDTAKSYLSQASLFGDTNLLILRHDKAIPTKELKELLGICLKSPNSFLLYELTSNEGKKIASYFSAKHKGVDVRFFPPKESEAINELRSIAKEIDLQIDDDALSHLFRVTDSNLTLAANELHKLAVLDEPIGTKEIDRLVFSLTTLPLERLYHAIATKAPLAQLLAKLEAEEQNEMKVLLGLQNYFQQLFLFYSYIRLHGRADSKEILGYKLPRHVEEERTRLAIRIKNYPDIFLTLQECEHSLKTRSDMDKKSFLLSCLMKIQVLI